jgi:hypothetical protein
MFQKKRRRKEKKEDREEVGSLLNMKNKILDIH